MSYRASGQIGQHRLADPARVTNQIGQLLFAVHLRTGRGRGRRRLLSERRRNLDDSACRLANVARIRRWSGTVGGESRIGRAISDQDDQGDGTDQVAGEAGPSAALRRRSKGLEPSRAKRSLRASALSGADARRASEAWSSSSFMT